MYGRLLTILVELKNNPDGPRYLSLVSDYLKTASELWRRHQDGVPPLMQAGQAELEDVARVDCHAAVAELESRCQSGHECHSVAAVDGVRLSPSSILVLVQAIRAALDLIDALNGKATDER